MENSNQNTFNAEISEVKNYFMRDCNDGNTSFLSSNGIHFRIISNQGTYVTFEAVSQDAILLDTVNKIQTLLGYNPKGYGGPEELNFGRYRNFYTVRWRAWNSCD